MMWEWGWALFPNAIKMNSTCQNYDWWVIVVPIRIKNLMMMMHAYCTCGGLAFGVSALRERVPNTIRVKRSVAHPCVSWPHSQIWEINLYASLIQGCWVFEGLGTFAHLLAVCTPLISVQVNIFLRRMKHWCRTMLRFVLILLHPVKTKKKKMWKNVATSLEIILILRLKVNLKLKHHLKWNGFFGLHAEHLSCSQIFL